MEDRYHKRKPDRLPKEGIFPSVPNGRSLSDAMVVGDKTRSPQRIDPSQPAFFGIKGRVVQIQDLHIQFALGKGCTRRGETYPPVGVLPKCLRTRGQAATILEHHTSSCNSDRVKPLIPLRKRGRPPKVPQTPGSSYGCRQNQRGRL
ncbi:hypothetical protein TNIN_27761 [Trichonephila inaurata madagascariensis]|uniref:Copper-fist domain-containing protein n=1 Tax=Trichonephila inaurata madagascariensis TaxID=2747483 RepID=A0A8X7CNX0_9ARAC|nr:hypothetical protein TNIN_27761 [Trichonephila inaurata madagascariensis]